MATPRERVKTVEEALDIAAKYLTRAGLADEMRETVGLRSSYGIRIIVEPTWKGEGISLSISQSTLAATPGKHPKLFFGGLT